MIVYFGNIATMIDSRYVVGIASVLLRIVSVNVDL